MKRGSTEHPKFKRLCRRLPSENPARIVGILELLWQFTARVAKAGDIGKWTDEDIAEAVFWSDKPVAELIEALVSEGWLDRDRTHRLVVHGWSEHADDATHMSLARAVTYFADGRQPRLSRLSREERPRIEEQFRAHAARTPRARRGVSPPSPAPPSPARAKDLPDGHPAAGSGNGSPASSTWDAYSEAYRSRYSERPLRNAPVNSMIARFVTLVPGVEAPAIATYYVRSSSPYYVERGHPVELLVRDALKLRTEWKTGRTIGKGSENQLPTVAQLRARGDL